MSYVNYISLLYDYHIMLCAYKYFYLHKYMLVIETEIGF